MHTFVSQDRRTDIVACEVTTADAGSATGEGPTREPTKHPQTFDAFDGTCTEDDAPAKADGRGVPVSKTGERPWARGTMRVHGLDASVPV